MTCSFLVRTPPVDHALSLVTCGDACTDGAVIDAEKSEKFLAKIPLETAAANRVADGRWRGMNRNSAAKPGGSWHSSSRYGDRLRRARWRHPNRISRAADTQPAPGLVARISSETLPQLEPFLPALA